MHRALYSRV